MPYALTPAARDRIVASLEEALVAVRAAEVITDCRDCHHFTAPSWCERWGAEIPSDVTPKGCDEWAEKAPF
ncbi:hypothetical protein [Algiphilus sp.]|uniref:hypothetical protein n=1 Tax=Algiphilus sp. TaxID=1872431 RepID=UPI003BAAFD71